MIDSTTDSVTLAWDKIPDDNIENYFIEVKARSDADFKPIGRVDGDANTFTCNLLEYGVPYWFRVKARNEAGYSQEITMNHSLRVKEPAGSFL